MNTTEQERKWIQLELLAPERAKAQLSQNKENFNVDMTALGLTGSGFNSLSSQLALDVSSGKMIEGDGMDGDKAFEILRLLSDPYYRSISGGDEAIPESYRSYIGTINPTKTGELAAENLIIDYVGEDALAGYIESGVFATFSAPDMVNHVHGTDYGVGTAMPNWGYITVNYTDNTYTTPDGLNIGWEAHDGVEANLGVVSDGDPFFVQAEADLGLVNGMLGRSAIPVDSVTIGAVAQQAAAAGITINIPTENPPYMAGGTGIDLDGDGYEASLDCDDDNYYQNNVDPSMDLYEPNDLQNPEHIGELNSTGDVVYASGQLFQ